jgi:hypothetical protein
MTVLMLVLFGLLSSQPPTFLLPRWAVIAFLGATTALLATRAVIIRLGSRQTAGPPSI